MTVLDLQPPHILGDILALISHEPHLAVMFQISAFYRECLSQMLTTRLFIITTVWTSSNKRL